MFNNSNAIALLGATVMTVATVGFSSPSQARESQSLSNRIEESVDRTLRMPGAANARKGTATLAIWIDAQGQVSSISLVRSSGDRLFDREALRTARKTEYPAPGKPRLVAMVLGFNHSVTAAEAARGQQWVEAYGKERQQQMLAGETPAQPTS